LLISEIPPPSVEILDGQADLVAAAYAYTSGFDRNPASINVRGGRNANSDFDNRADSVGSLDLVVNSPAVASFKEDFIQEALIAEVLVSNLAVDKAGKIEVWGTKVDIVRLIQVYSATAGICCPTTSLVLRRLDGMIAFLRGRLAASGPTLVLKNLRPIRALRVDIQEMEP
jgi:hypothetical protein